MRQTFLSFFVHLYSFQCSLWLCETQNKGCVFIVTLKNIADACGVSVSTVSRAFDKHSRISLPVRQQILSCASEMGYAPNLIARSLKKNRTMTIAMIIPSIDNRFYIDVLKYVEIALHQFGYRLVVSFVQDGIATECECLEMMVSAKVDGIILIPQSSENQEYVFNLTKQLKLIQLFTAPFEEIDSVVMDDNCGAEAGANYLLSRNHRKILYAGGEDRLEGFLRAISAAQIPSSEIVTLPWNASVGDVCDVINKFQPSAIFSVAHTNETVWTALQQLKLSIPDDISLISYDNTKWIKLAGITAVAHDLEELATALVNQLISRLNESDNTPPKHIVLKPFIIERTSVKMK